MSNAQFVNLSEMNIGELLGYARRLVRTFDTNEEAYIAAKVIQIVCEKQFGFRILMETEDELVKIVEGLLPRSSP
jgi:hypothetical protein